MRPCDYRLLMFEPSLMEFTVLLAAKTVHALFGPLRRKRVAL